MAKDIKKEAQLKSRQTKLMKKSHDELVDIVLRKDKTERNLNNQIVNLKGEVNTLNCRVNNFDSDMEGTMQSLETYKDKCKTLQEQNDSLKLEISENKALYENETRNIVDLRAEVKDWKIAAFAASIIAIIAIIFVVY